MRLPGLTTVAPRGVLHTLREHGCVTASLSQAAAVSETEQDASPFRVKWVFLGPPGVGKGTYATRLAQALGVPHVAAGDLVREEIKRETPLGLQMKETVNKGNLLPDHVITQVVKSRLDELEDCSARGFILDGFPRTRDQAQELLSFMDITLALNLTLREEVLVEKCLGRRICSKCGKNYNIADIYLPAEGDRPEIILPPLNPPKQCLPLMGQRADDTEEVVRKRLQVYHSQAAPVEEFFRQRGLLVDFEITAGIPETLPVLADALRPYTADLPLELERCSK